MAIYPYLTFSGNCRVAMTFYKECLGGELTIQMLSDSPNTEPMPSEMKENIVHASLISNNFSLMASDMASEVGLIQGNSISLFLQCRNENEIKENYDKLSAEGERTHPIIKNHYGSLIGDLKDKFGIQWILYFQPAQ